MSDDVAADAEILHAHLVAYVAPDGTYARNLNTAAAEIGWTPDHLSLVMQELCAQERVLPDHAGGSVEKIANSRWLVLDYDGPASAGDDLDAMTVPKLREFAEENGIELGEATKKPEIRAKIDASLAADPNAQVEV